MKNEEFATAAMKKLKNTAYRMWMLAGAAFFILHSSIFISCSDETTEATEWDNWAARNEVFFATLQDSLQKAPAQWQRIKSYSLDPETEGKPTDYIYAKSIEQGSGTASPAYTDSVRVIYQGRLIPTATYPQGYVFDGTVNGTFSVATSSTAKMLVSAQTDGFSTALQHMHKGDRWRIYVPCELAYGVSGNSGSIPGSSVLVFDLQLIDFCQAGTALPTWSARRH